MSHPPALIIHGHFYQPPRENPWTGIVEREPSAAPHHDWNERIYRECYRTNAYARVLDPEGAIADIVNNYKLMSFNVGPTLLSWLERHHPRTLRAIVRADRASVRERGHGNAIAQGYNHAILPLCNDRDLRTQVRWGLIEFRHRFGRDAESMWLPETACDDRVLSVLIDEGLRYVLLAPGQAERVRVGDTWRDVSDGSIDPQKPYKYLHRDGSGRSIALFFYDGAISRAVAFEGALSSSHALIDRCEAASHGKGSLVHAATDGESYGHHFTHGDRCLAYALSRVATERGFWVTNYGELLDRHPATVEVEIKQGEDGKGTSWSCAHGVGRWLRDCGCHTGGKPGWSQRWRGPLRGALDVLRERAAEVFEQRAGELCDDPWALRDAYAEMICDPSADRGAFFERQLGRSLDADRRVRVLELLESQRSSMTMYTSCGWFFSELSGIETIQVMRYAGRLCDQLGKLGVEGLEDTLLQGLAEAESNLTTQGTGADIYRRHVAPTKADDARIAVHISLSSLPLEVPQQGELADRRYRITELRKARRGRTACTTARIDLERLATGATSAFATCSLFFGGVDLHCVLRSYDSALTFEQASDRIHEELDQRSLLSLLRVVQQELGSDSFSLGHLLPSGKEAVSRAIFLAFKGHYALQYEAMYQDAQTAIAQFHDAGLPLPTQMRHAVELALDQRLFEVIEAAPLDHFEASSYAPARDIVDEATRYSCTLQREPACRHLERHLARLMDRVCAGDREGHPLTTALELLRLCDDLDLELELDRPQEQLHRARRDGLESSEELDELARALGLATDETGR